MQLKVPCSFCYKVHMYLYGKFYAEFISHQNRSASFLNKCIINALHNKYYLLLFIRIEYL